MNYIKEVNAFRNYLRTNPIPAIAQALWYAIIDYHNHSNWESLITIDNLRLMADLQISKGTLIKHRNILIQNKLLLYKSIERKKHMGKYSLVSLIEKREFGIQSGIENEPGREPNIQTGTNVEPKCKPDHEPGHGPDHEPDGTGKPHCELVPEEHKQNKTKLNNIIVIKKENKEKKPWVKALEYFCKKSNKIDLQLRPCELESAKEICEEVQSLNMVLRGIDQAFDKFKPGSKSDKINSFKYCVPIIKSLYARVQGKEYGKEIKNAGKFTEKEFDESGIGLHF